MRKFKTESKKLLDLMINSIYTDRDIFLRELISNASDAVDKLYFKSLTDSSIQLGKSDMEIFISFDKDARTITVSDNGIGMTAEELDRNLGVIAHSDSLDFKTENAENQGDNLDIIGQFGVGFYSSFIVADKVTVVSRAYGSDEANSWTSDGVEGYTIKPAEKEGHGTDVILTLKEDTDEENYSTYLTEYGLTSLIKRFSNYVRYPIRMEVSKRRELPKPEDAGDDYVPQFEDYTEVETINSMIPIWKRRKSEVSDEEYNEYYMSDFHDFQEPARVISTHAEGSLSYDALLFIPSHASYDLYSSDYKKGLALYSSNVLIMEKCEDLLPDAFAFVRGVVDSQDLSLNISRETLQQNNQLRVIAKNLEKKIKKELVSMRDKDRETYEKLWNDFGRMIKFSLYAEYGTNRDLLQDLMLFYSAKQRKLITFDEYVADMPEGKTIYYAAGESIDRLAKQPIVTSVLTKGHDVLLCTMDVDEFVMMTLGNYGEGEDMKYFKNVAGGDLGLETEDEREAAESMTKENEGLFVSMQEILGGKVNAVEISSRLTDSPVCLTARGPVSLEMEKMFANMPQGKDMKAERVLEINPNHEIFKTLQAAQEAGDTEKVKLFTEILYSQALLVEGLPLEDPVAYAQAVCQLMK